ncbi:metalloprotease TldD [Buchnera aphidicola]|uniref:metalloprotease TldD n=1 Tax=Buchnera aphidicola TaxID=9 RepID=UPI003463F83F
MLYELVSNQLLLQNGIQEKDINSILYDCISHKIDYADIYLQSKVSESFILENKIIKEGKYNFDQGFGIRVFSEETTGFSYSNCISLYELKKNAKLACSFSKDIQYKKNNILSSVCLKPIYPMIDLINNEMIKKKIDILNYIDCFARKLDSRVIEVNAVLTGTDEKILIASTDGTLAADVRPLIHLSISVLVEDHNNLERGYSGGGGRIGYEFLYKKNDHGVKNIEFWTREAVENAVLNLFAKEAPSGTFPVVLGSGWPGVLIHEAVGHGLEGDFNFRKSSVFYNKLNKKVASSLCTIVDDGTMLNRRGSISIDDEGILSQYNILIKNGILKKYMQDRLTSKLMHMPTTGNGRRESYAHLPKPRMTNTYLLPGKYSFDEIVNSIEYGILALNFSGGQVDITSGKFVFSTSKAFLLKNGKIMYPIKGTTLIGSGIEVMKKISMIGNDFKMDEGIGVCMKDNQSIPVGVGQPTIKINALTIGGTI